MWEQAEGVSRPSQRSIAQGGSLRLTATESTQAKVLLQGGKVGILLAVCEPPVVIKGGNLERFKVRVTDTGFAWNGRLRLTLLADKVEKLQLPAIRVFM